jgi:hypothetical protein
MTSYDEGIKMEERINVYYINGKFLPRTEGLVLAAKLEIVCKSKLPPRVKRMRIKRLQRLLAAYYFVKWGTIPEGIEL